MRDVRRRYSLRVRELPPRDVVALAEALLGRRCPGRRFVAYELILSHPAALATLRRADLERLGEGLASWSDVDSFACILAGRAWREGQVSDRVVHAWARSRDRWWRRTALVCSVPLNIRAQGGTGDPVRTLGVCRLLVSDRDDMVEKSLSWALRALSTHDAAAVGDFLRQHEEQLGARVLREVRNKLETGRKNPKRSPGSRP